SRRGGKVGISRSGRDFQGRVGDGGNLLLVWRACSDSALEIKRRPFPATILLLDLINILSFCRNEMPPKSFPCRRASTQPGYSEASYGRRIFYTVSASQGQGTQLDSRRSRDLQARSLSAMGMGEPNALATLVA